MRVVWSGDGGGREGVALGCLLRRGVCARAEDKIARNTPSVLCQEGERECGPRLAVLSGHKPDTTFLCVMSGLLGLCAPSTVSNRWAKHSVDLQRCRTPTATV